MRNKKLIPFEVIQKAVAGEPEAVDTVLRYYNAHIKYLLFMFSRWGTVNPIPPPFPIHGKGGGSGGYIPRRAGRGGTAGAGRQGQAAAGGGRSAP